MVYHEVRKVSGKEQNYLLWNRRENRKWIKKSRFIGFGKFSQQKINELKKEFENEIIINKKYLFLSLEEVTTLETLKEKYFRKIKTMHEEEYLQFEQSFFTELTYNSNAIEGSSLSLEETDFVINKNIVPEGKSLREIYEAQNHVEALRFLKEYQGDLNEKLILILHSIITKNVLDRFSGAYRKTQVRIFGSNVAFPPADKVPQLIKNLIYWYKKNKNKY